MIDPKAHDAAFGQVLAEVAALLGDGDVVAVDGKVLRGSRDAAEAGRTRMMVSAYAARLRRQAASRRTQLSARLQKMPGIGPVTAMAIAAFAPAMETFGRSRDFPAWLGVRSVSRTDRVPVGTAGTAFERWKAKAGPNQQVRAERCRWPLGPAARTTATPAPADHRRDGGDFRHQGAAACREFMARPHPCAQAADAGGDRAGQQ